ncbi:MAG: hypothetical protein JRN39_00475 [Nitrososphaerota archaeon]|nr:hypothetical protein [Nitrososphaerota archaeon]MDG6938870.1 hypothetical protein [Nitrososphaerota archaeon]
MGRSTILFGFWIIGYALGFIGFLFVYKTNLLQGLYSVMLALLGNAQLVDASLVGLATSFLSLAMIIVWSYSKSP